MHFSNYSPWALITAALVVGCNGDPAATTAPSFSQTSTLLATHRYGFTFSCSNAAQESMVQLTTSAGDVASGPCGLSVQMAGLTFFVYYISVREMPSVDITVCTDNATTTGVFKCKIKKWSATLTVTDLGPGLTTEAGGGPGPATL